jgi:hypothetical protein
MIHSITDIAPEQRLSLVGLLKVTWGKRPLVTYNNAVGLLRALTFCSRPTWRATMCILFMWLVKSSTGK